MVLVHGNGIIDERVVEKNPGIINALVERVGVPFGLWHRKTSQSVVDGLFDFDVTTVVVNEMCPSGRIR